MAPVYAKWKDDPVTILASPGEVQLHLRIVGEPEEAARRLDAMEADFRQALGHRLLSRDEDLSASVGRLLRETGRTVAVAESCTGGLIAKLLTDAPGSSDYFLGGLVAYSNGAKVELLAVREETLRSHGAVSEETASEMAGRPGALRRRLAVAVTGIAGRTGERLRSRSGLCSSRSPGARGRKSARNASLTATGRPCGWPLLCMPWISSVAESPMPEKGGIRAFLAIPSDGLWVESARGLLARLEPTLPRASWTKPSSWHLTLKFFERIPPEPVTAFCAAIARVAAELVPGEMRRARDRLSRGPARVLGVGFAPSPALDEVSRLAREAETQARALGLPEEKRAFHPHVTLARLRSPWPDEAVATFRREVRAWSFPAWQARACVLYEPPPAGGGRPHAARGVVLHRRPRGVRA